VSYPAFINTTTLKFSEKVVKVMFRRKVGDKRSNAVGAADLNVNVLWIVVDKAAFVTLPNVRNVILSPNPHP
jgi:hypothetical protein